MLHVGKYIGYVFRGAYKIMFYPYQAKKYIKNKDDFPIKERYEFVQGKARTILNKYLKVKLDVRGMENLNKDDTYLFIPNHQGMLDPVCLFAILDKPVVFVSKKEARDYPVAGKIEYMVDAVFLDRESPRDAINMIRACNEFLKNKRDVAIFAEGTRSKDEEVSIHTYKAGSFKCAYGTGAKIVPVVIDKSYIPLSTKIKNTDKIIKVSFLPPIDNYEELNTNDLALRVENMAKDEMKKLRKEDEINKE
jgi:1-acyl-sn-glycerol-3-phosphate acyltransferase